MIIFDANPTSDMITTHQNRSCCSDQERRVALQRLQVPLKAVVDGTVLGNYQEAVLRYNDDPDVGWVLVGNPPAVKRDGIRINFDILVAELFPFLLDH